MSREHEVEVEVKFKIGDAEKAIAILEDSGWVFGEVQDQDDQAYAPIGWDYGQSRLGVPFGRLRTQNRGECLFTVKVPIDNEMSCREAETVVADRGAMAQALELLGWRPTVRIRKTRRAARSGSRTVCIDVVEHAGAFLEVEEITDSATAGLGIQAALGAWVREDLGIDAERCEDTYDTLVRAALEG